MAKSNSLAEMGPIMQIAYVVPDLQEAMKYWADVMGVGPFFWHDNSNQNDILYRGKPGELDISFAIAYWGDMQIELIQPNDDKPSIYREALDAGNQSVHHVCIITDDMEEIRARCAAAGRAIIHEAKIQGGELLYVDFGGAQGTLLEVLMPPPGMEAAMDRLKQAAQDWDGSDPIRRFFRDLSPIKPAGCAPR